MMPTLSQQQASPSRLREFHPEPLTDPYVNLSIHTARATGRGLPSSIDYRVRPVAGCPEPMAVTCPLRSTGITPASTLLRSSPPLSGASVLSASRLEPLAPFSGAPRSRTATCSRHRQTGLVNNLNFGLSRGRFPLFFARLGLTVGRIGIPTSIYPGVCSGSLRRRTVCDRVSRRSHKAVISFAVRVSGALFRAWLRIGAGASGIKHERGRREAGLAPEARRVTQGGARSPAWTISQPWPATTQEPGHTSVPHLCAGITLLSTVPTQAGLQRRGTLACAKKFAVRFAAAPASSSRGHRRSCRVQPRRDDAAT